MRFARRLRALVGLRRPGASTPRLAALAGAGLFSPFLLPALPGWAGEVPSGAPQEITTAAAGATSAFAADLDGLVHVIDRGKSYPFEELTVDDSPGPIVKTLNLVTVRVDSRAGPVSVSGTDDSDRGGPDADPDRVVQHGVDRDAVEPFRSQLQRGRHGVC